MAPLRAPLLLEKPILLLLSKEHKQQASGRARQPKVIFERFASNASFTDWLTTTAVPHINIQATYTEKKAYEWLEPSISNPPSYLKLNYSGINSLKIIPFKWHFIMTNTDSSLTQKVHIAFQRLIGVWCLGMTVQTSYSCSTKGHMGEEEKCWGLETKPFKVI